MEKSKEFTPYSIHTHDYLCKCLNYWQPDIHLAEVNWFLINFLIYSKKILINNENTRKMSSKLPKYRNFCSLNRIFGWFSFTKSNFGVSKMFRELAKSWDSLNRASLNRDLGYLIFCRQVGLCFNIFQVQS